MDYPSTFAGCAQGEQDWYELFSRGARDWLRHNEKVRRAVRDQLPELLAHADIQGGGRGRTVKVPVRFLEHFRFRLRDPDEVSGAGQGDVKPGDQLARPGGEAIGRLIPIEDIEPNPDQPRQALGDLAELTASVREKGILEPLLVRKVGGRFEIIAGERRYRAAVEAGLSECVPPLPRPPRSCSARRTRPARQAHAPAGPCA